MSNLPRTQADLTMVHRAISMYKANIKKQLRIIYVVYWTPDWLQVIKLKGMHMNVAIDQHFSTTAHLGKPLPGLWLHGYIYL